LLPYGRTPPDTVEFAQNNDTVYFAQPTLSQLVPGGSGSGTFNVNQTASLNLGNNPNDTLALLTNGNAPRESMGELLRYAPPIRQNPVSPIFTFLDILSGESEFIAKSYLTLQLTCELIHRTLGIKFLMFPTQDTPIEPVLHLCLPSPRFPPGLVCFLRHESTDIAHETGP
jgi:hypothetical protein